MISDLLDVDIERYATSYEVTYFHLMLYLRSQTRGWLKIYPKSLYNLELKPDYISPIQIKIYGKRLN